MNLQSIFNSQSFIGENRVFVFNFSTSVRFLCACWLLPIYRSILMHRARKVQVAYKLTHLLNTGYTSNTQNLTANFYAIKGGIQEQMKALELSCDGGRQPYNNLIPYLVLNFCIAVKGIFPARN